jgi:hypothetical protein
MRHFVAGASGFPSLLAMPYAAIATLISLTLTFPVSAKASASRSPSALAGSISVLTPSAVSTRLMPVGNRLGQQYFFTSTSCSDSMIVSFTDGRLIMPGRGRKAVPPLRAGNPAYP